MGLSWIMCPPPGPITATKRRGNGDWLDCHIPTPVPTGTQAVIRRKGLGNFARKTEPKSCHSPASPDWPLTSFEDTVAQREGIKKEMGCGLACGSLKSPDTHPCLNPASSVDCLFHERPPRKTPLNTVEKEQGNLPSV